MGIPHHLTYFLRSLYVSQEAIARARHGTTDWFQIGKGVRQSCMSSPCLFNFYTECIVQNAGLDESQDGIKIGRRNINSIRYANDRYHSNGRKQGGTKKPLEEGEGGE